MALKTYSTGGTDALKRYGASPLRWQTEYRFDTCYSSAIVAGDAMSGSARFISVYRRSGVGW